LRRHRATIEHASRNAEHRLAAEPKLPVQKVFYEEFAKALHGARQSQVYERRLREAFASLANPMPVIDWTLAARRLKAVPSHAAIVVVKTWANSWATSDRYHDGKLEFCCFGCFPERDRLEHYVACESLWGIVSAVTRIACPAGALERMCIENPTRINIMNLLVAHGTYHTMKLEYLDQVRAAQALSNKDPLLELATEIAKVLALKWSNLHPLEAKLHGPSSSAGGETARSSVDPRARHQVGTADVDASPVWPHRRCADETQTPAGTEEVATGSPQIALASDPSSVGPQSAEDYCEPECSDLPAGSHHPCCVLHLLNLEAETLPVNMTAPRLCS
jgi:hypothetical protein